MGSVSSKPSSSSSAVGSSSCRRRANNPDEHESTDLSGDPIYLLVRKKTVIEGEWPEFLLDFVHTHGPDYFRHWAVRVGDSVWEIGVNGATKDSFNGTSKLGSRLWDHVERLYDQHWMGMTEATPGEIKAIAKQLASEVPEYHLFESNCQSFATELVSRIPKTDVTAGMTERARITITERAANSFRGLLTRVGLTPDAPLDSGPEQIRDFLARMRNWLLRLLHNFGQVLINGMVPILLEPLNTVFCALGSVLVQAIQTVPGAAQMLLERLIAGGPAIWSIVSHPIAMTIVFGTLVIVAVFKAGTWAWEWFCSNKDLLNNLNSLQMVYVRDLREAVQGVEQNFELNENNQVVRKRDCVPRVVRFD